MCHEKERVLDYIGFFYNADLSVRAIVNVSASSIIWEIAVLNFLRPSLGDIP